MWAIIGTWEMVKEGIIKGGKVLADGGTALDAAELCVMDVEANPNFVSVGYGGLPNKSGVVELDAAVMDGNTLSFGAVAAVKNFKHPCKIARQLSLEHFNNYLVGDGAEIYALQKGFIQENLLTEESHLKWQAHKTAVKNGLKPYIGHDTVCVIGLDQDNTMVSVTSTSGLFYKHPGRVGDSSIVGAGFFVDSEIGGATATGLGEDLMKGLISYEIVRLMGTGLSPQTACEQAVTQLNAKLIKKKGRAGDLSVIAINRSGDYGGATNIESFPFVVMTEKEGLKVFNTSYISGQHHIKELK